MPFTSRNTAGTTAWTCPYGIYRVQAYSVGSGGAGGQRSSGNNSGAAGGRGGGFGVRHSLKITPTTSYNLTVGAVGTDGATPANGGSSTFTGDASVVATGGGGASCAANSQTAPAALGLSVGDLTYEGGAGGAGSGSSGGGGGGAGFAGVGGDASGITAGIGTSPGGDGATGRSTTGTGATATGVGGGGAGGRRGTSGTQTGGAGGPGLVLVRWHAPNLHMMLGAGT